MDSPLSKTQLKTQEKTCPFTGYGKVSSPLHRVRFRVFASSPLHLSRSHNSISFTRFHSKKRRRKISSSSFTFLYSLPGLNCKLNTQLKTQLKIHSWSSPELNHFQNCNCNLGLSCPFFHSFIKEGESFLMGIYLYYTKQCEVIVSDSFTVKTLDSFLIFSFTEPDFTVRKEEEREKKTRTGTYRSRCCAPLPSFKDCKLSFILEL